MMSKVRLLFVVLLAVAALGACGDDTSVGEGLDTNVGEGGGPRLGEATSTVPTLPSLETTVASAGTAPKAAAGTAAPRTTPTQPAAQVQVFEVAITAGGFEPANVRVYVGQPLRYTNKDSETRSVKALDNSFGSGDLAPGATWMFPTSKAGNYDIGDGSRPYVVGTVEVLAR